MKNSIFIIVITFFAVSLCNAQNPVGKWKMVSHISTYEGQTFDSHSALLTQRPCASKIVYEVNADATYRLNASESGCDEKYTNIQQRLYSKTKWKVEGNKITISATNFAVGQTYILSFTGNKMVWVGTEGQGTITYQKL
jgi:hypothetical protein